MLSSVPGLTQRQPRVSKAGARHSERDLRLNRRKGERVHTRAKKLEPESREREAWACQKEPEGKGQEEKWHEELDGRRHARKQSHDGKLRNQNKATHRNHFGARQENVSTRPRASKGTERQWPKPYGRVMAEKVSGTSGRDNPTKRRGPDGARAANGRMQRLSETIQRFSSPHTHHVNPKPLWVKICRLRIPATSALTSAFDLGSGRRLPTPS